jgi:hypothetical protein
MRIHRTFIFALVWCALLTAVSLRGDPLMPILDKTQAMTNAAHDQKLVLLVSGLPSCTDCIQYENLTLQTTNPPMRQFVEEALVYWNCREEPPYSCRDYAPYVTDFGGSFPLPLICVIDPAHPNVYVQRTFGGGSASIALSSLRQAVLKNTKPRISNLTDGGTLSSANLTVRGSSRWTNLPIANVYYQLNDSPSWTRVPIPDQVNWSVSLDASKLKSGPNSTNTFRVYAENVSFIRSQTNVVNFFYQDQPPKVISGPTDIVQLSHGETATFAVQAEGSAPLSYQWRFVVKGTTNDLSDSAHISGATSNVLTISSVTTNDEGSYVVTITNNYGATNVSAQLVAVTCPAILGNPIPKSPAIHPKDLTLQILTARVGDTATFAVTGYGEPPLYYQWLFKSGVTGTTNVLSDSPHISGATTNVLTISNVTTNDAGEYRVVVTNHCTILVGDLYDTATLVGRLSVSDISDTVRPTLAITSPTLNQRWSNAVFTVKGTAKDNAQVAGVWCLTNSVWGVASTANGWTNWTVEVAPVPGTNTVRAYAVDGAGNKSLTNSVNFVYVVTNRLSVVATGKGTISPNYSNAWLEIGRQYSMTATASSGYAFTNWVISTNWTGGVAANNATVQFMMQSNLTLQVNFADVTRPTIAITSPKAGQKVNAVVTATGTASDNAQVAAVNYQLNSNAWAVAMGTTSWSAAMSLLKGTNVLRAYALDAAGNPSTTNLVAFVSTNDFQMNLSLGSAHPLTETGLDLYLEVTPGLNGRIESSTNLVFWTTLTNFVGTNVPVHFRDSAAPNYSRRFYRAVSP